MPSILKFKLLSTDCYAVAAPCLEATMLPAQASGKVERTPALLAPSSAHALHAPTALPDLATAPKAAARHTTGTAVSGWTPVGAPQATSSAALVSLQSHPTGPAPFAQGTAEDRASTLCPAPASSQLSWKVCHDCGGNACLKCLRVSCTCHFSSCIMMSS